MQVLFAQHSPLGKTMKKRFTFKCWNCERTYTLFREITNQQTLQVACPYCKADGVVDLAPYLKDKKIIVKREGDTDENIGHEYQFPDVLPTNKPE